jgi:membrane-bound inhibitor of C-type lysozyme
MWRGQAIAGRSATGNPDIRNRLAAIPEPDHLSGLQRKGPAKMKSGSATLAGVLFVLGCHQAAAEDVIATVKYACADDKTIEATYYADKVDIVLGDGREMSLPQTMSGSGIRYANADESFVFWSKGNTAFATEGDPDKPTYADCTEVAQ